MNVCHEPGCNQMKKQSNIFAAVMGIYSFKTTPLSSVLGSPVLYAHSLVILCSFLGRRVGNQFSVVGTLIEIVSQKACVFLLFYVNAHVHTSFGEQISI